jgi:hypothetical protein
MQSSKQYSVFKGFEELDANRYNATTEPGIIVRLMMTQYKGRNM